MMNIKTFYLGSMMTNCYITWNDDKIVYLFDCGGENIDKIMTFFKSQWTYIEIFNSYPWAWGSYCRDK